MPIIHKEWGVPVRLPSLLSKGVSGDLPVLQQRSQMGRE